MTPKNIVIGQKVDPKKAARALKLRHNLADAEQILWQHLRANRLDGWHFRR
jgi:very-short-patch-repair endonuclease